MEKTTAWQGFFVGVVITVILFITLVKITEPRQQEKNNVFNNERLENRGKYYKVKLREITKSEYNNLGEPTDK